MELKTAQTILKIVGILSVIGAVIGLIISVAIIAGGGALAADPALEAEFVESTGAGANALIGVGIGGIVSAIAELVEGIFSLKAAKDAAKWKGAWILALAALVLGVIGMVAGIAGHSGSIDMASDFISVSFSALIFWAANTVKQNAGK